jgi:hypothetical protein
MTEDRDEGVRMIRDSVAGIAPRTGDFRHVRALRSGQPRCIVRVQGALD